MQPGRSLGQGVAWGTLYYMLAIGRGDDAMPPAAKPRIAVFSGPTATIQNSEPLVTSNKARHQHSLPLRTNPDGSPLRFDALRPQRLPAPVTVYIEQFSAQPLDRAGSGLYRPVHRPSFGPRRCRAVRAA